MKTKNPRNQAVLITYADSMGKNIPELHRLLLRHFKEAVGGVHLLPFYPSSADRGFAPLCYDKVDSSFGTYGDVRELAKDFPLTVDFMVNHISRSSDYFKDFQQKKDASPFRDYFIRYQQFWPGGEPTQQQADQIYKRKPRAPYVEVAFADGTIEKIWCTFGEEQIDLNVFTKAIRSFFQNNLRLLCENGASVIRLDAFAYAVKKPGTNCFFVEPEIWSLLEEIQEMVQPYGVILLPEVHEHYTLQLKLAEKGYWVYDFALPMLVLHALYTGEGGPLAHWLTICPRNQFTTLDTHDGIGVVDVKDLLPQKEIERTKDLLYQKGANVKRIYSSAAYQNLDIYQINCTYYSALGDNDQAYLLARAIQFFAPGIPQIYYVGLLAGKNDVERMENTRQGRDINRHAYSVQEVESEIKRPVVKNLLSLMRFRNQCPAFSGTCTAAWKDGLLTIHRESGTQFAALQADLKSHVFTIRHGDSNNSRVLSFLPM